MKNKKFWVLLFIFILLCLVLTIIFINKREDEKIHSGLQYVYIDDLHCWEYGNHVFKKRDVVLNANNVLKNINWKDFDVFVGNKYQNTYKFVYTNGNEYLFDDNDESYEVPNNKILVNKGSYFKFNKFKNDSITSDDNDVINKLLKSINRSSDNLLIKRKYNISFNEDIYILSNYNEAYVDDDIDINNLYNVIFYRKNYKNYILLNSGYVEGDFSYDLSWILDTKDDFNTFIFSYNCYEIVCYNLFYYDGGSFVNAI